MRVFVTGATGFIGSAIVQDLINAGYQVTGLARSPEAAQALKTAGAESQLGSLEDLESLKRGAAAADGVIHAGFIHDFSKFAACCEIDRRAIEVMGSALIGSNRPLVVTSGTALVASPNLATEDAIPKAGSLPRIASEEAANNVAANGGRVSILRLPPSVHGDGDHGFVPILINLAREKGASAYLGEGHNRWPAVHRLDAARLFRLVLEKGTAGAAYHGAAEEGVPMREIAGVIGRRLNIPVVSKPPSAAGEHFGWFAHFASLDNPASSRKTQEALGWKTIQPGLIADLDRPEYFKA